MNKNQRKYILLSLVVLSIIGLTFLLRQQNYLSLDELNRQKYDLIAFVECHYLFSAMAFILTYIIFSALLLPGAILLSISGGVLFGVIPGTLFVTIGATAGAFSGFLMTRYFIGNSLQTTYAGALTSFNAAVTRYGSLYLFVIRLIPLFPFFLVNILAGLTQISSGTFVITTALGMLPVIVGFTFLGAQLRHSDTFEDFFTYPLAIAGLLILLPLVVHTVIKRRKHR